MQHLAAQLVELQQRLAQSEESNRRYAAKQALPPLQSVI